MTAFTATRVISFVLVGVATAFCQRDPKPAVLRSLPDAPSPRIEAARAATLAGHASTFSDTGRLSVDTVVSGVPRNQGDFALEERSQPKTDAIAERTALLFRPSGRFHFSSSDSLFGRATDAATSIVLPRDENGDRHLNTSYLLRVLTAAAAHSAYRPYWRRSISQPFSDFGSTIGNDAGLNVFHEFEPGILQLVKTHQPRFVSKIGEHFLHK
jgi:hypothetical protein